VLAALTVFMSNAILFITIPLAFVSFITAVGMFESAGGVDILKSKRGRYERIIFWPLTYTVPPDAPIVGYETELMRLSSLLSVPLFFAMSLVGYSQFLIEDTATKISATLYAILVIFSIFVVVA